MKDFFKKFERNKKNEEEENNNEEETEEEGWIDDNYEEGQLSVDVFETPKNIIIKSTIAGVKTDDLDISLNNDMLTIRGERKMDEKVSEDQYLYRECYWGPFSRSIILPTEVDSKKIDATLESGILTVVLKKTEKEQKIEVKEKD